MLLYPTRDPFKLAVLQAACFPYEPWSVEAMIALMEAPEVFALAAGDEGFIMARAAAGEAEILAAGVLESARARGLGRALVEAVIQEATARGAEVLFLEVAEDNAAAQALYRRCAFRKVGRRPGYYARPEGAVAALVLRRDLIVS